jgi:hypothetical protein
LGIYQIILLDEGEETSFYINNPISAMKIDLIDRQTFIAPAVINGFIMVCISDLVFVLPKSY